MPKSAAQRRIERKKRLSEFKKRLQAAKLKKASRFQQVVQLSSVASSSFKNSSEMDALFASGLELAAQQSAEFDRAAADMSQRRAVESVEESVQSAATGLAISMLDNSQRQMDAVIEMGDSLNDARDAIVAQMAADNAALVAQLRKGASEASAQRAIDLANLAAQQQGFAAQEAQLNADIAKAQQANNAAEVARLRAEAETVRAAAAAGLAGANASLQRGLDAIIQKQQELLSLINEIQQLAQNLDENLAIATDQINLLFDKLRAKFPDKFPPSPPFYLYYCLACGSGNDQDRGIRAGAPYRATGCAAETTMIPWIDDAQKRKQSLPPNMLCFKVPNFEECLTRKLSAGGVMLGFPPVQWTGLTRNRQGHPVDVGSGPNKDQWDGKEGVGPLRKVILDTGKNLPHGALKKALQECLSELAEQLKNQLGTGP
jgi:hypothetical protein